MKISCLCLFVWLALLLPVLAEQKPVWSAAEQPIADQLRTLRQVPDSARGEATRRLAAQIRQLPSSPNKLALAEGLANLSTEGDFGRDTLQDVATTLADALREQPGSDETYLTLAQLIRYEHVQVTLDSPALGTARAKLEALDRRRAKAGFTLLDLDGNKWTLRRLRGKVVLVNFWATWCPPCRKEIPDLGALYARFRDQGFVVLGISDEERTTLEPFVKEQGVKYPVLLDPHGKAGKIFGAEGIPKSFVYDREGKLVATAIDMRTMNQLLAMVAKAGLK